MAIDFKSGNAAKNYDLLNGISDYLFGYIGKYDFILIPPKNTLFRKVKKCGKCVYKAG